MSAGTTKRGLIVDTWKIISTRYQVYIIDTYSIPGTVFIRTALLNHSAMN